jgi:DNA-directed RNA polymerase subunit H (RpoH/RPB5)
MNIQKHMEAIFISVLAIIGLGTLTMENLPKEVARAPIASNIGTPAGMAVVVIRAPRAAGRI